MKLEGLKICFLTYNHASCIMLECIKISFYQNIFKISSYEIGTDTRRCVLGFTFSLWAFIYCISIQAISFGFNLNVALRIVLNILFMFCLRKNLLVE